MGQMGQKGQKWKVICGTQWQLTFYKSLDRRNLALAWCSNLDLNLSYLQLPVTPSYYNQPLQPSQDPNLNRQGVYDILPELYAQQKNQEFPFAPYHAAYTPFAPYRNMNAPVGKRVWRSWTNYIQWNEIEGSHCCAHNPGVERNKLQSKFWANDFSEGHDHITFDKDYLKLIENSSYHFFEISIL